MLTELRISNFALIRELQFAPSDALTIITGETGAGKSIMVGAVGLLLGERADTKALYDPQKKGFIEGDFEIEEYNLKSFFQKNDLDYESNCIIRREISPAGKSRAFINDTPTTLDILRQLGNHLMDIHSQHDTLLLRSVDFQLQVLDAYAEIIDLSQRYEEAFQTYKEEEKELSLLKQEHLKLAEEFDYIQFQREEIDKAGLQEDEQEDLEQQVKVLENSEEIKANLNSVLNILRDSETAVASQIQECLRLLAPISSLSQKYQDLSSRLQSLSFELNDLVNEISSEEESVEFEPSKAEELKSRLSLIYHLQQKHRVSTIKELIEILEELSGKVNRASDMESSIRQSEEKVKELRNEAEQMANVLSQKRKKAIPGLSKELASYLKDLGMPDSRIEIQIDPIVLSMQGIDRISFLFSANKGVQPKPLKQVASGGEFSRLMFCLKYILARKSKLPTVVFDEIDNGVSGEIALKLGKMMKSMAESHQVITISHLPQIAARGDSHFFVYKEVENGKAASRIRKLSKDERVEEVAKMIAGDNPTQNAFESARELIAAN